MKPTKYDYAKVIQQNYGQGWEDVSEYPSNSQGITTEMSGVFQVSKNNVRRELKLITYDLRGYKELPYPTRVIFRKTLKTE